MKYMVIETFKPGKMKAVYARFNEKDRMLPFNAWTAHWDDLMDFEIVELADSPTKAVQQGDAVGVSLRCD